MRRRSAIIQFVGVQGIAVLAIIQSIVLVPLYLRYVGEAAYGQWLALGSTVVMLGLVDFGVTSLTIQRTAHLMGAGDLPGLGRLIGSNIIFNLGACFVVLVVGFGLSFWLPAWVGAAPGFAPQLSTAFRIAAADVALMLLVNASGGVLIGLQQPTAHMVGMFIATIASILLTIVCVRSGLGVVGIAVGSIARPCVALPINVVAMARRFRSQLGNLVIRRDRATTRDFMRSALWLGPAKCAETLTVQADNLIVVKLLSPVDVTILVITRKAAELSVYVVGRLSASLMSGLAHLRGSGDHERLRAAVNQLFIVSAYAASGILCGVVLLNERFVGLWTNHAMYGGLAVTLLACVYSLLRILRVTFYNVTLAAGDVRFTSVSLLAEAGLQVVLGTLCCYAWGMRGVLLGAIAAVTVGITIQFVGLKKMMPASAGGALGPALRIATVAGITLLAGSVLRRQATADSWRGFMLQAAAVSALYVALVFVAESRLRRFVAARFA